jgi:predicted porin
MKKSLLAVAIAAALPTAALAQSNVTMFGILDLNVENLNATGAGAAAGNRGLTRVGQGLQSGSRFGIRGVEDIGGGLKGVFTIEHRLSPDTGAASSADKFWFGQSWAGLEGGFGRLTLGRQYSPLFFSMLPADFSGYAMYNNWVSNANGTPLGVFRINDQIQYRSPTFGGATVYAAYAPGETAARTDIMGISVGWQMGALYAALGHHSVDNAPAGTMEAVTAGAISYKTAAWGVSLGYSTQDLVGVAASTDRTMVSAMLNLAGGTLIGNAVQTDTGATDRLGIGLAYTRPLSKRTNWYAAYGTTEVAAGDDNRFAIGLRHNF